MDRRTVISRPGLIGPIYKQGTAGGILEFAMDIDQYRMLSLSRRGRVLEIRMNAPEKLNLIERQLRSELARAFIDIISDSASDVAVLTWAGHPLSADDEFDFTQMMIDKPEAVVDLIREGRQVVSAMLGCEKPVIAKVKSNTAGLGAMIALLCDIVFVSDKARIGDPRKLVSLVGGDGVVGIWPQLISFVRAKEYLMAGDLLPAMIATEAGLAYHAVPAEQLDGRVDGFADQLATSAIHAICWAKKSVNTTLKPIVHALMDPPVPAATALRRANAVSRSPWDELDCSR